MEKGKRIIAACCLLVVFYTVSVAQGMRYEAELAQLEGTLKVENSQPGYSGTGYVARFESESDKLTFTFSLSTRETYDLYLGYAAPYGDKINMVEVNGNRAEVQFIRVNGGFGEVRFGKIRLREGQNQVTITKSWGWFLFDYIRIVVNTTPDTPFNLSQELVTPDASDFALHEYRYLLGSFKKNIHSGVQELTEAEWLRTLTGKYPALLGVDLINHTRDYTWFDKQTLIDQAKAWYANRGLLTVCWHWRDPLRTTEEFYTEKTAFDISRIADTLSREFTAMVQDIDRVAPWLKQLQEAKVPVLFRPLHEASGGWFWWGAKGPEPCKALWKLIFQRLTRVHGINNLIWVWTADARENNLDWYPGDEVVDIIGADIYPSNGDFGSQVLTFDRLREAFSGRKMITLSENGVMPDPDNLVSDQASWAWFMTWTGSFVRNPTINPVSHWQKIMDHDYVLTLDEMPDRSDPSFSLQKPLNVNRYRVATDSSGQYLLVFPLNGDTGYNIRILDLTGRICGYFPGLIGNASIPLRDVSRGIHIIRVESAGQTESFKTCF